MALKVSKAEVWAATIDDRAGGAADQLEKLSKAGANLEMLLARRTAEQPGKGVMFVTPLKGKAAKTAQESGMGQPQSIHSVRIEGGDKPGLGSKIARALGDAGINFRGMSAIAMGKKFVSFVALDSADDQARAIAALKKLKV
ncbi:MAG TPA: ACT domain-containing protein [Burkholderiales bacterium]|nr:ACT domain-containing protein [Burkholderiales bacterium]